MLFIVEDPRFYKAYASFSVLLLLVAWGLAYTYLGRERII